MTAASPLRFEAAKWSIFAILILTYILVYFHRMAPGVVADYLMAEFSTTGTRLGTLSAIYFLVYAVMQIPSGVLADTLGIRASVVAGNLTAGAGSICFGLAGSFETACLGRFLVGLGVSVVFVSIMKSNSIWFHERVFGFMSGLTLLIGNLGSVVAAGPLSLALTLFAWRSIFVGIGILSLALAFLGFFIIRNRPEDLGFPAPNRTPERTADPVKSRWLASLRSVMATPGLWPGFWVQFGMIGGLYAFMGLWGIPFLKNVHGLDRSMAARHMTVMLLCFALGALFFGWFSDRMGRRRPILLAGVILYNAAWLALMKAPWAPGVQGCILFGVMGFAGSSFVLTFACAKEIIHPGLSGMAVSVVNTGCFIGTALMQPLFGWIADLTWDGTLQEGARLYSAGDYRNGFIAMAVFALIGLAGAFKVHETYCRNISMDAPRE
jgi:sugar phosphate permease